MKDLAHYLKPAPGPESGAAAVIARMRRFAERQAAAQTQTKD